MMIFMIAIMMLISPTDAPSARPKPNYLHCPLCYPASKEPLKKDLMLHTAISKCLIFRFYRAVLVVQRKGVRSSLLPFDFAAVDRFLPNSLTNMMTTMSNVKAIPPMTNIEITPKPLKLPSPLLFSSLLDIYTSLVTLSIGHAPEAV